MTRDDAPLRQPPPGSQHMPNTSLARAQAEVEPGELLGDLVHQLITLGESYGNAHETQASFINRAHQASQEAFSAVEPMLKPTPGAQTTLAAPLTDIPEALARAVEAHVTVVKSVLHSIWAAGTVMALLTNLLDTATTHVSAVMAAIDNANADLHSMPGRAMHTAAPAHARASHAVGALKHCLSHGRQPLVSAAKNAKKYVSRLASLTESLQALCQNAPCDGRLDKSTLAELAAAQEKASDECRSTFRSILENTQKHVAHCLCMLISICEVQKTTPAALRPGLPGDLLESIEQARALALQLHHSITQVGGDWLLDTSPPGNHPASLQPAALGLLAAYSAPALGDSSLELVPGARPPAGEGYALPSAEQMPHAMVQVAPGHLQAQCLLYSATRTLGISLRHIRATHDRALAILNRPSDIGPEAPAATLPAPPALANAPVACPTATGQAAPTPHRHSDASIGGRRHGRHSAHTGLSDHPGDDDDGDDDDDDNDDDDADDASHDEELAHDFGAETSSRRRGSCSVIAKKEDTIWQRINDLLAKTTGLVMTATQFFIAARNTLSLAEGLFSYLVGLIPDNKPE
ncbi:hypothetical protein H696_06088 [Fonticula alba]|uniref:Uncharacterized protein n=1 Tax=Fonticula alba TaxID=691883 RepID=A0A058YZP7_FONAL|nr:hypothetical protein H696_06088 [Fonticula alba]KCV67449.1 hypothetical protein H696_06088 [Fonticula alba]|eukprot:XP_009498125.1 hypothetical protein H696_06088 [Fonticula alba]